MKIKLFFLFFLWYVDKKYTGRENGKKENGIYGEISMATKGKKTGHVDQRKLVSIENGSRCERKRIIRDSKRKRVVKILKENGL